MAITLGAEVGLSLHFDQALTYTDVETTLLDAGFINYSIMRTLNADNSSDVQIYVRNNDYSPLSAADTMQRLTAAITALDSDENNTDSAEEPPAE